MQIQIQIHTILHPNNSTSSTPPFSLELDSSRIKMKLHTHQPLLSGPAFFNIVFPVPSPFQVPFEDSNSLCADDFPCKGAIVRQRMCTQLRERVT